MKYIYCILALTISLSNIIAQENDRLSLFIDCQTYCDFQYIKQEIQFVNYIQNRQDADVYVLVTRQRTGGGGKELQMVFIGNNSFETMSDTIQFFIDPNATDAIEREIFVKELKRGLLPYLINTSIINNISYQVGESSIEDQSETEDDPWNYWTFNVGGNGNLNGEATFSSFRISGRLNAARITDDMKLRFSTFYNFNESTYKLSTGNETFIQRNYNARLLYVKSINQHWSLGFRSSAGSSTFGNTDLSMRVKPAVEYNVYPYSEASTKRFSFNYSIGPEYYDYTDTTIFNVVTEVQFRHGVYMEFNQTQKWGNVSLDAGAEQFLHQLSLFNVFVNPNIEWQIFKGLSIDIGGFVSFVNDRINIAKSDISDEDILLGIRQLDTDFTYFSYFGVNYRFGSKYNNFVNVRF